MPAAGLKSRYTLTVLNRFYRRMNEFAGLFSRRKVYNLLMLIEFKHSPFNIDIHHSIYAHFLGRKNGRSFLWASLSVDKDRHRETGGSDINTASARPPD